MAEKVSHEDILIELRKMSEDHAELSKKVDKLQQSTEEVVDFYRKGRTVATFFVFIGGGIATIIFFANQVIQLFKSIP